MIGSTWSKWDLHLHSPLTHQNNQFNNCTLKEYASAIKAKNLSAVGITNYFYFEDDELEIIKAALKEVDHSATVFGNIEFRISQPNKDGEWINIHCIFSDSLSTKTINDTLATLPIINTNSAQKALFCSKSSIRSAGVNLSEVIVDCKALYEHLNKTLHVGRDVIIAICPNGYGGYRPSKGGGRSNAFALEMEKHGNIILGRPQDRDYFLDQTRYTGALAKPVFNCSDAHSIAVVGEKYTWVKAKPTFEGLRQAIIEPADRVHQTDQFVERNFIKPHFKSIKLSGNIFPAEAITFSHQTIPLNSGLVAIIGGRGTGKSLFLDAIYSKFHNHTARTNARKINVSNIEIVLDKGDGQSSSFNINEGNSYSYLHVPQGHIQTFSNNPKDLSAEIMRMLGIHTTDFNPIITQEIQENLSRYRGFVNYWNTLDDQGNYINQQPYQNRIVEKNMQLISTLTNPQNTALIDEHKTNTQRINLLKATADNCTEIIARIDRAITDINAKITPINSSEFTTTKIPLINAAQTVDALNTNINNFLQEIADRTAKNTRISQEFISQGINQDVHSLLNKITEYQQAIDHAKLTIQKTDAQLSQYTSDQSRRRDLIAMYAQHLSDLKEQIDSAFSKLLMPNQHWSVEQNLLVQAILEDISINGNIFFDKSAFYKGLEDCLNKGKFKSTTEKTTAQRLEDTFNIRSTEDFFRLINGEPLIQCDDGPKAIEEFFWKNEYFNRGGHIELLQYLFQPSSINKFLFVNAIFTYKGKGVEKLSIGQRGTFYVCLKLATDPFGSPFIFDQPEDDLDNDFIMHRLVPLFKKIKKYRQVIIVTHNANLVVNSDAEQVIVAHNESETIRYDCGALEDGNVALNIGTRSAVCNILEGGQTAFERRDMKYGL